MEEATAAIAQGRGKGTTGGTGDERGGGEVVDVVGDDGWLFGGGAGAGEAGGGEFGAGAVEGGGAL